MTTVLSKSAIRQLQENRPPLVEGYRDLEEQIQPNGFDITLRDISKLKTAGSIAVSNTERRISAVEPLDFDEQDGIDLPAGAYVVTFNEIVNLPNDIMALGKPRSSLLRCGVAIHNAVWDAGYSGRSQALLVVYNPLGFRVQRHARVLQLVFLRLTSTTEGYRGIYQNENV